MKTRNLKAIFFAIFASSTLTIFSQSLESVIDTTLSDLKKNNLNKSAEYVSRDFNRTQLNKLRQELKSFDLKPEEVNSFSRAIFQKTRQGKVGNLNKIDIEAVSKFIDNQNKFKGYIAESLNYEQLQKIFPESQGYKIQYTKPGSISTDIIIMKDGKPFKFIQTKFCKTASKSGLSCMGDALEFYADKPINLNFNAYIPQDQYDELVKSGYIDSNGKLNDISKWNEIHQKRVEKIRNKPEKILKGTKYERYIKYKDNPEKIEKALKQISFKPLNKTSTEIIDACENAKSGLSKALKYSAKSSGENSVVGSKNAVRFLKVGKHTVKVVEKVVVPVAVTLECGLTISNAREIEERFERGEIGEDERDIEHGKNIGRCVGNLAAIGVGGTIFTVASPFGSVPALLIGIGGTVVASYMLEYAGEKAGGYVAGSYHDFKMSERAIYSDLAESYYSAFGIHELSFEQLELAALQKSDKIGYLRSFFYNSPKNQINYVVVYSEGYEDEVLENFDELEFMINRL